MLTKKYIKSREMYQVKFELPKEQLPEGVPGKSVTLVGEFNDWQPGATPMPYSKKKKAYWVALDLLPGRAYQFRYLVDGVHWCNDWQADGYMPNMLGEDNCVVVTPAE